jgi:hypothetical protein
LSRLSRTCACRRILTRAIDRYRARYPALTTDLILDTLEKMAMLIWAIRDEERQK